MDIKESLINETENPLISIAVTKIADKQKALPNLTEDRNSCNICKITNLLSMIFVNVSASTPFICCKYYVYGRFL